MESVKRQVIALLHPDGPGSLRDAGLLALRLSVPVMMAVTHGLPKLLAFSERTKGFADPLHVGPTISLALVVFAEFFCNIFVAMGLATRFVAFFPLFTMLVAAVLVHGGDPWSDKELPLLYASVFFALVCAGPGKWSIDRMLQERLGIER